MNYYQQRKAQLKEEAKQFQLDNSNNLLTWLDIAGGLDYFYDYGKRYGLIKEFRNEGII